MYQRIPGPVLSEIKKQRPLNYAVLELPSVASPGTLNGPWGSGQRDDNNATWKTHAFAGSPTLATALRALEAANTATKRLQKLQLNFANGSHVRFARSNFSDANSLAFRGAFNPAAQSRPQTAPRRGPLRATAAASEVRAAQAPKFLVDDRGRALQPKPRLSSFHPESLFKDAPRPSTPTVGFAFTPVSSLSYQMRPNSAITGCRPNLRDTNPAAVHHRPRPLSRAASPNLFESVDARNRATPQPGAAPRAATPAGR